MEKVLCLVHTDTDGAISKAARVVLQAALDVVGELADATLTVGLIGEQVQAAADTIGSCGASKLLGVAGVELAASRYATDAAAAQALIGASEATLVLAPATSRFARALPGVAQRLNGCVDTKVVALSVQEGELQAQRWYYRQRMVATLKRAQRPWLLLLDSGVCAPWQGEPARAAIELLAVDFPPGSLRTRVLGEQGASADAKTIRPDAELLLVAGAGWCKKQADGQTRIDQAESLLRDCLSKTQASLGSSKSLVDQSGEGDSVLSFLSHLNQVGQTGATPRHAKGLATCCHGEEPHVVGWRFINERRAINTDAGCGWAQGKADVLYVADAFALVAAINTLLVEG